MNPKKSRPEYEALVERILSRELTRAQASLIAAEQTGSSPQTFLGWITANKEVREKLKPTRGSVGANSVHAHTDPDKVKAYDDALSLALSGKVSTRAAALKHGVSYEYLCRLVRKNLAQSTASTPATDVFAERNDQTVAALAKAIREAHV